MPNEAFTRQELGARTDERYLKPNPESVRWLTYERHAESDRDLHKSAELLLEGARFVAQPEFNTILFDYYKGYLYGFALSQADAPMPLTGPLVFQPADAIAGAEALVKYEAQQPPQLPPSVEYVGPGSWEDAFRPGQAMYFLFRCVSVSPFRVHAYVLNPASAGSGQSLSFEQTPSVIPIASGGEVRFYAEYLTIKLNQSFDLSSAGKDLTNAYLRITANEPDQYAILPSVTWRNKISLLLEAMGPANMGTGISLLIAEDDEWITPPEIAAGGTRQIEGQTYNVLRLATPGMWVSLVASDESGGWQIEDYRMPAADPAYIQELDLSPLFLNANFDGDGDYVGPPIAGSIGGLVHAPADRSYEYKTRPDGTWYRVAKEISSWEDIRPQAESVSAAGANALIDFLVADKKIGSAAEPYVSAGQLQVLEAGAQVNNMTRIMIRTQANVLNPMPASVRNMNGWRWRAGALHDIAFVYDGPGEIKMYAQEVPERDDLIRGALAAWYLSLGYDGGSQVPQRGSGSAVLKLEKRGGAATLPDFNAPGGYVTFDGVNDCLALAAGQSLGIAAGQPRTLAWVIKMSLSKPESVLLHTSANDLVRILADGTLNVVRDGVGSVSSASGQIAEAWAVIVIRIAANGLKAWKNGSEIISDAAANYTGGPLSSFDMPLYDTGNAYVACDMKYMGVMNAAVSDEEVLRLTDQLSQVFQVPL